jgi:hypothetical protein
VWNRCFVCISLFLGNWFLSMLSMVGLTVEAGAQLFFSLVLWSTLFDWRFGGGFLFG